MILQSCTDADSLDLLCQASDVINDTQEQYSHTCGGAVQPYAGARTHAVAFGRSATRTEGLRARGGAYVRRGGEADEIRSG